MYRNTPDWQQQVKDWFLLDAYYLPHKDRLAGGNLLWVCCPQGRLYKGAFILSLDSFAAVSIGSEEKIHHRRLSPRRAVVFYRYAEIGRPEDVWNSRIQAEEAGDAQP